MSDSAGGKGFIDQGKTKIGNIFRAISRRNVPGPRNGFAQNEADSGVDTTADETMSLEDLQITRASRRGMNTHHSSSKSTRKTRAAGIKSEKRRLKSSGVASMESALQGEVATRLTVSGQRSKGQGTLGGGKASPSKRTLPNNLNGRRRTGDKHSVNGKTTRKMNKSNAPSTRGILSFASPKSKTFNPAHSSSNLKKGLVPGAGIDQSFLQGKIQMVALKKQSHQVKTGSLYDSSRRRSSSSEPEPDSESDGAVEGVEDGEEGFIEQQALDPYVKTSGMFFHAEDHGSHELSDLKKLRSSDGARPIRSKMLRRSARKVSSVSDNKVDLKRGGVYIRTSIGPVQIGMPPETIKDVLENHSPVAEFYVCPMNLFNLQAGISCSEFEFPMYYSWFLHGKAITLVCKDDDTAEILHTVLRESLSGPDLSPRDWADLANKEFRTNQTYMFRPDFMKELKHFEVKGSENIINTEVFTDDIKVLSKEIYLTKEQGSVKNHVIIYNNRERERFEVFDFSEMIKQGSHFNHKFPNEWNTLIETDPLTVYKDITGRIAVDPFLSNFKTAVSYYQAETVKNPHLKSKDEDFDTNKSAKSFIKEERKRDLHEVIKNQMGPKFRPSTVLPKKDAPFKVPTFGVTVIGNSHGFDKNGSTTGFVIWINGFGVMVDPPPHSGYLLEQYGIRPKSIKTIILTHCHADHDAGTFQKILSDDKIEVMTTPTIYESFLRKYSAMCRLKPDFIKALAVHRGIFMNEPNYWNGAVFRFFYSFHSIPCIGFEVSYRGKKIVYSGDTFFEPDALGDLAKQEVFSPGRIQSLLSFPWDSDVIYHEAGVPPIHTPIKSFLKIKAQRLLEDPKDDFSKRLRLVHVAGAQAKEALEAGFQIADVGVESTEVLIPGYGYENDIGRWLSLIGNMELFSHLKVPEALGFLYACEHKRYSSGELILEMSPKTELKKRRFVIVLSGIARAATTIGETEYVRMLNDGDYFGEHLVLDEGGTLGRAKSNGQIRKTYKINTSRTAVTDEAASYLRRSDTGTSAVSENFSRYDRMSRPRSTNRQSKKRGRSRTNLSSKGAYFEDGSLKVVKVDKPSSEKLEALTEVETLEVDFFGLRDLLSKDDVIKQKIEQILVARFGKHAWRDIDNNPVLCKLELSKKTELLGLLSAPRNYSELLEETREGEEVPQRYIWTRDSQVEKVVFVHEGKLKLEKDDDSIELGAGTFLFEFVKDKKHHFDLIALEGSVWYEIPVEKYRDFWLTCPRLMLATKNTPVFLGGAQNAS